MADQNTDARAGDGKAGTVLVPLEPTPAMTWAATVTADREWCYHVGRDDAKKLWAAMLAAAPAAAPAWQPLPKGWTFNHAQQQTDEDGSVHGVWEIGYRGPEDDSFSPILTVDTWLYSQEEAAEAIAKAILERLNFPSPATAPADGGANG